MDSVALSPVVAPGEVARDVVVDSVFEGGANVLLAALVGVKPKLGLNSSDPGLNSDFFLVLPPSSLVAAGEVAGAVVAELGLKSGADVSDFLLILPPSPLVAAGEVAGAVVADSVLKSGADVLLVVLAGVKPNPKLGVLVGVVLTGLDAGFVGVFTPAPKSPPSAGFDGLGENLIALSGFQVWSGCEEGSGGRRRVF